MKIHYYWKNECTINELHITANPANESYVKKITNNLHKQDYLEVIDPKNNRKKQLFLGDIKYIKAFTHLSKVYVSDGQDYLLQKKLKELHYLENHNFFRINNATILNLDIVSTFASGSNARLEVFTNENQTFVVSRHYAKNIKERLS